MHPYPVQRYSDNFRVAQCRPKMVRPCPEDRPRNLEGVGGVALLDHLRKALFKVGFSLEGGK
jgi:hypothetical protein